MRFDRICRWSATIFCIVLNTGFCQAQVIQDHTFISINNGQKVKRSVIKILVSNVESKHYGEFDISFDPNSDFELLRAEIQDLDGKTRKKFKERDMETSSDVSRSTFFDDDIVKSLKMYSDQVPYAVLLEYEVKMNSFVFAAAWSPCRYRNLQTLSGKLELDIPQGYPHHVISTDGIEFQREMIDNRERLTFQSSCDVSGMHEFFQPSSRDTRPYVWVQHHELDYGVKANCATWDGFGKWIRELNRDKYELPEEEQRVVENLVAGLSTPTEKARRLYYYLQDETTYVNVDVNFGGLESYPASYVSRNKFGDCKALTTYMKAMLKHVGIESAYTLVLSGEEISNIELEKPGQLFNHVILSVPIDGDTIWLENTASKLPFNYLGTFTQGRNVLAIYDDTTAWVRTPSLSESDVCNDIELSFYRDGEMWMCQGAYKLGGDEFEHARFASDERDELEELLINRDEFDSVQSVDVVSDRDSSYLVIHALGSSKPIFEEVGSFNLLQPVHFKIPKLERVDARNFNVHIPFPKNLEVNSIYALTEAEQEKIKLPENVLIESKYGKYGLSSSKNEKGISVKETFSLYAANYDLSEYQSFYDFFKLIESKQSEYIIVVK